jgi:chemotaxis signal transduction protein
VNRKRRERSSPLAALLAANEQADDTRDTRTLLAFEAGTELYAVDAANVEMVVGSRFVARIPTGPPELLGVVSVHGRMRLAVDFDRSTPRDERAKWWLVALHGDTQLAIIADRIEGLHTIASDEALAADATGYVQLGNREVRWLDPERILEL